MKEFIQLMRHECEMKVRYAMFYNYHKLLNDQTTTKHKFITFFRPSPSRKTFYREFFVSLRKSKSIIDWYTLLFMAKRTLDLNICPKIHLVENVFIYKGNFGHGVLKKNS